MQQGDTISAIATAQGEGGIGIIRISGIKAIETADKIFWAASGKKLAEYETQRAVFGHIVDEQEEVVDEAMVLLMRAPHSYTKEDVVVVSCRFARHWRLRGRQEPDPRSGENLPSGPF